MKKALSLLFVSALAGLGTASAQFASAPAFPGAEGYGRYVTGGRGGTIYHVTTLEDSTSPTAGMLRYAINKTGKRTIVFDVAGTIYLKDVLKINTGDLTILGQTAPGDGICIAGYPVKTGAKNNVGASNIIIRYLRFRLGDINTVDDDALSCSRSDGSNSEGIIIDHCSISWCTDEVGSFYGNKNFTLQWCILSEALNKNVAKASDHSVAHGYGAIWGGQNASFHHNLLANNQSRNPRFDHDYVSTYRGPIDYVNNCVYNWGNYAAYGGESCNSSGSYRKINMINNYYKAGPATPSSKASNLLRITTTCSNCTKSQSCSTIVPAHFYMSGNNISGVVEDGSMGITVSNYMSSSRYKASDSKWNFNTISIHSASNAFSKVIAYAGASYVRDAVDTRICTEAKNGTTNYKGTYSKTAGIIDSQSEVGGWPTLTGTKATDSDNDGMPDAWETANGLNKNSASDAITYTLDSKGYYTNLEVYANSLVESAVKAGRADATETFTEYYPSVSGSSSSSSSSSTSVTGTFKWDFQNLSPSSLSSVAIQSTTSNVTSSSSNSTTIKMYVDASSGKLAYRSSNSDCQINANTKLRIPVGSTSDVVKVVARSNYAYVTINGTAMSSSTVSHTATSSEVSQGYVVISATATAYLYSITCTRK